jgi:predicted SprT family Zn-dependent metalloprotease
MRYRQVLFDFGSSVIRKILPAPASSATLDAMPSGSAGVPPVSSESGQDARDPGPSSGAQASLPALAGILPESLQRTGGQDADWSGQDARVPGFSQMRPPAPAAPAPAAPVPRHARSRMSRDPLLEGVVTGLLASVGCAELQVSVFWNHGLRTTAGMANWHLRRITLNPRLAGVSADEVRRTLLHELAHLLAQHRAGRRRISAHGAEWRLACAALGIPGEPRCHSLPFERRRVRKNFFYECPVCATVLARVRRLRSKVACLRCCRRLNGGAYSERFRFRPIPPPPDPGEASGG